MMMYRTYFDKWQDPVRVFYLKRIMRLYPLFFVAAFAYIPLTDRYAFFNPDGLQVMDMVRVLTLTGGVQPDLLNAVVPGGWSIVDEIYFYLLFPFMFLLYGRVNMWWIGIGIAVLNLIVHYASPYVFSSISPYLVTDFLYRNLVTCLILFYAGIEAWRKVNTGESDFMKLWIPVAVAAVIYRISMMDGLNMESLRHTAYLIKAHNTTMVVNVLLAIGTYWLIIGAFRFADIFKNKHIEKFGTITYTGYIIHFGLIAILAKLTPMLGLEQVMNAELAIVIVTLLTIAIGFTIAPWTERYWQDLANKLCKKLFVRKSATPDHATVPAE